MSNETSSGRSLASEIDPQSITFTQPSTQSGESIPGLEPAAGTAVHDDAPAQTTIQPYRSPFHKFSLIGMGNQLEQEAVAKAPLLRDVCLTGDVTLWGAPPNSGKTLFAIGLLAEAITQRAVEPERTFLLNMDDSMSGVAEKVKILQDHGVHVLAEGYRDFTSGKVPGLLEAMIADGSARGSFVIVDTLKKVVDPMDKRKTVEFMKLARRFVLAGASILLLAHTNKQRGTGGKLILAGVADLQDDCDTAYLLDRQIKGETQQVVFENIKRRGGGASCSVYTCSAAPDISYVDRLMSIRYAGSDPAFDQTEPDAMMDESAIIEAIRMSIQHGTTKKGPILELVRMAIKASRASIKTVLEKHTDPDPELHLWDYTVRAAGANVYELHRPVVFRAAA